MVIRRALFLLIMGMLLFVPAGVGVAGNSSQAAEKPLGNSGQSNPIGPVGLGIKIANETGLYEVSPAVAYNSTHSEYLVVWYDDRSQNDDIWGQRLTTNGTMIGLPFPIASTSGIDRRYPRIAYNVWSDQYLVVWEQHGSLGSSICGRRVSSDGWVMDTDDIVFETNGEPTSSVYTPAVAYATISNKYLVVWSQTWNSSSFTTIYGQVVLGTGVLDGSRIIINAGSGLSPTTVPDLAYNLLKNEYLVVWQQLDPTDSGPLSDIWGGIVSGDGGLITGTKIPIALYNKSVETPAVASLPVQPDGQYFVAWALLYKITGAGTPDHDIVGRTFSASGVGQSDEIYISNNYEIDETMPGIVGNASRNQFMVTWRQVTILNLPFTLIGGRLLTPSGSLASSPFSLGGLFANHPRVAAGPLGDFLTVFDDTPFTPDVGIYGQLAGNRTYLPFVKR